MSQDKEWIGCSGCGSVWLGVLAEARDDTCPYCRSSCEIVPVQGPSFSPTRSDSPNHCPRCGGHWITHRADGGDCAADDVPDMAIGEALAHLTTLVHLAPDSLAMAKRYSKAIRIVKDAIGKLTKERDALSRQLDLQLKLHAVVKQHIADSIGTIEYELRLAKAIRDEIIQAIEAFVNGDIDGAIGQLRGLVSTDD